MEQVSNNVNSFNYRSAAERLWSVCLPCLSEIDHHKGMDSNTSLYLHHIPCPQSLFHREM